MPSLGNLLRGGKSKKSGSETTSSTNALTDKRQSSSLTPPHLRMQRTHSIASVTSLSMFRKKDKSDFDSMDNSNDFGTLEEPTNRRSTINSQSLSATNGLAALRISTPSSFRPSGDTTRPSNISHDTPSEERISNVSPQSTS